MVQQSTSPEIWGKDPDGAPVLPATGRARHDPLVIAEPAFLRDLDQTWGRPSARVCLSFLSGIKVPSVPGHRDTLMSYKRGGFGVFIVHGRTSMYEGGTTRIATALAQIANGIRLRAALLVTRATPLRGSGDVADGSAPKQVRVVTDHLNVSGGPLFPAPGMVPASWGVTLTERLGSLRGMSGSSVIALASGPLRPSPVKSRALVSLDAGAVVTDSVVEAMVLASRGVAASALIYPGAPAAGGNLGRVQLSLRQVSGVTLTAAEETLRSLWAGP